MFKYFEKGGLGGFDFTKAEVNLAVICPICSMAFLALTQVVALMGAHSLGKASRQNSGYQGEWTAGEPHLLSERLFKFKSP